MIKNMRWISVIVFTVLFIPDSFSFFNRYQFKIQKVTIPPGSTNIEIALILTEKDLVDPDKFLKLAENSNFEIDGCQFPSNLEGYLFPDTYYFVKGRDSEESIIAQMLSQFQRKVIAKYNNELITKGYNLKNIMTMASLVEEESIFNFEKPLIAAVFYNRLKVGMRLQCDPTIRYARGDSVIRYAFGKYLNKLTTKDLKIKSSFNTYFYPGLPPHPICNPGLDSIEAVLRPVSADYLYFVSKNNKTHYFSSSYEEHRRAKFKYGRKNEGFKTKKIKNEA